MNEARPPLPERAAIDAALHRHSHPALDEEASWEWREWRWLALLPSQVFWVAPSLEGWARLEQEGELLGAAFHATGGLCPQVCFSDPQARLQVRTRIDGINGRDRYAARAMDGYDLASSASLDRARVGHFHVRSAFEEFAWVTPESPRFPHIVGWARAAAEALTPEWA